jgi:hypothetical protein
MNPLAILGVITVLFGAAAGLMGHLLLKRVEQVGELKVELVNRQAIIDQKNRDADLSEKLAALQTLVETKLKTVGNETRQAITNATSDDLAAIAARDGIMRLKSGLNPRPPTP